MKSIKDGYMINLEQDLKLKPIINDLTKPNIVNVYRELIKEFAFSDENIRLQNIRGFSQDIGLIL